MAQESPSGKIITSTVFNQLVREHNNLSKIHSGPGLLFNNGSSGPCFWLDPNYITSGTKVYLAYILSSEMTYEYSIGLPVQWRYSANIIEFQGEKAGLSPEAGYNGTVAVSEEYPEVVYVYNLLEWKNSSLSTSDPIMGCGVNIERLKTTFPKQKPQPIPQGAVITVVRFDGFWWCSYENAIDGECS